MTRYPYRLIDGHLFCTLPDGDWLVDTGAGQSLGRGESLTLAGRTVPTQTRYLGATLNEIQDLVGTPLRGLIGQDLLMQFDIVFDHPGRAAYFQVPEEGFHLTLTDPVARVDLAASQPVIAGFVENQRRRFFLDTGAPLNYYQLPHGGDPAGLVEDFFPGVGRFTVPAFIVPVTLAGHRFPLRAARLPAPMASMLTAMRVDGILGSDLFRDRRVGFFPSQNELALGPFIDPSD